MAEKRSAFLLFINTSGGGSGTGSYALVGDGVTELSIAYNAQTSTNQYIHQDTATTTVTGYQPNAPVTSEVVKGDPAFEYINSMRRSLPIGSDAETEIVMVDVFDGTGDSHPAIKQKVAIQIDSYGGPASDPLSIGYTINWIGAGETGTFNVGTKSFSGGASGVSTYGGDLEV